MSGSFGPSTDGTGNSYLGINGSTLETPLQQVLMHDCIEPGSNVGYETAKLLYLYHPLGAKMAESPIKLALSQERKITIEDAPDAVLEAWLGEWRNLDCDNHIFALGTQARVYGICSLVIGIKDGIDGPYPTDQPIPLEKINELELFFNVVDPLNTSGSLVLNQMPNSPNFQKHSIVTVAGVSYHPSRSCVLLNGQPIYLAYNTAGFGFTGRSVYQQALFPLKSFIQTMITDDMVAQKAGVLIAKIQPQGSVLDKLMEGFQTLKRIALKGARTRNVITISTEESIESLNLQNVDGAMKAARDNIIQNIAIAAPMPSQLLANEVFVKGFGEGTEDAKYVAHYIDGVRSDLRPVFDFFEPLVMARAWSKDFYAAIQHQFPETYGDVDYNTAFYRWKNAFKAEWPSLLTEPDSEKVKVDKDRMESVDKILNTVLPVLDPANAAKIICWAVDCFNENEMLFQIPLSLDMESLQAHLEEMKQQAQNPPAPPGMGHNGGPGLDEGEGEGDNTEMQLGNPGEAGPTGEGATIPQPPANDTSIPHPTAANDSVTYNDKAEVTFEETDHPRAANGQFGSGGGGSEAKASEKEASEPKASEGAKSKPTTAAPKKARELHTTKTVDGPLDKNGNPTTKRVQSDGSPLPAHIEKLKLPPGWSDVKYSNDPKADLLAQGKDAKGRVQSVYSKAFSATNAAAKFERINELLKQHSGIQAQNERDRQSADPKLKDSADCSWLIMEMGIRPGSDDDTGADKKAYGATNLKGEHVVAEGEDAYLRFTGKKGVSLNLKVSNPDIAHMLKERSAAAGSEGALFPETDNKKLLDYTHTLGDGSFKTKDFRTRLATDTAYKEVSAIPAPKNQKEYKEAVKKVAVKVSSLLGNTPTIALQSYINPVVFSSWNMGAE